MTFYDLYRLYGCDVETIAKLLKNIDPWMIDRLINRCMRIAYEEKKRPELAERNREASRDLHVRRRDENRAIRAGRPA